MLETPVAFLIFNRPDTTRRVFAEIARAKPKKLLVIADGPRHEAEAEKCQAARAVIDQIDWDCELLTNFSDVNLGCKRRVSSGLDWVFEQCEEAIILEDDCLPHPSFFHFCAELLNRFRDDERVMTISGNSFLGDTKIIGESYYFGRFFQAWGWASWRRAWRLYDSHMRTWPVVRDSPSLLRGLVDESLIDYWRDTFNRVARGEIDTWDYQWFYSCWIQNALSVMPAVNLITNVGFGSDATHTKDVVHTMANVTNSEISFPLSHPDYVLRNYQADYITFSKTNPWAVTPPGLYFWLRERLLLFAPQALRRPICKIRERLKLAGHEAA